MSTKKDERTRLRLQKAFNVFLVGTQPVQIVAVTHTDKKGTKTHQCVFSRGGALAC